MNANQELDYRLYLQREEQFVRTEYQSEFSKYVDIKNGDVEKVRANFKEIKKEYYKGKGVLSDDPLRNTKYHFVVSAAMVTRMCVESGLPHNEAYTISDIYIQHADKCTDAVSVINLLEELHIYLATRMREFRKKTTCSIHIRRAIDYIYEHLDERITLKTLADREGLNTSYFSRLFTKETGDSVKKYIKKIKVNTAKRMLEEPTYSIEDISLSLGFSSQSAFTAVFKEFTNTTPAKYKQVPHLYATT